MIYKEFEQKYLNRGESVPYTEAHLAAAEEIFNLYKNSTYFGTRNEEHRSLIIEGWAIIMAKHFANGETHADGYKEPAWGENFQVR
jgi:hypothetical protein